MAQHITTHNSSGQAVFSTAVPSEPHVLPMGNGGLSMVYTAHQAVTDVSTEADLQQYSTDRTQGLPPGQLCPPNGFATGIITFAPNGESPMHRTMTLDVDVILEGVVELILDSGEKRVLKAGDSVVMRGTSHKWRNITPNDGVAKMVGTALPVVDPVNVGGQQLTTNWNL